MLNFRLGTISRRLAPLYVAAFLQSFVFWYVIEKLFMRTIGFTDATIGLMAGIYSAVMLLIETPSGILADRWSRKGVLIVGSVFLAISSYICGASNDIVMFIAGSALWGIYYALYSGTYDSIIYDTLQEEQGTSDGYERYYGRIRIMESAALVVTSLLGGFIGQMLSLRTVFFATIPFALLSIVPLLLFREPTMHKAETETPISQHVLGTFKAVLQRGALLRLLTTVTGLLISIEMLYEFTQLWYIAIAMPIALYGIANALLLSAPGLSGWLAKKVTSRTAVVGLMALGVSGVVGMVFARHSWIIILLQAAFSFSLNIFEIIFSKRLHDQLPSKVRAGAVSAVSTLSRLLFIPLSIAFGQIADRHTIFSATWVLVGVFIVALIALSKTLFAPSEIAGNKPA